jgi:hypothetical protein
MRVRRGARDAEGVTCLVRSQKFLIVVGLKTPQTTP